MQAAHQIQESVSTAWPERGFTSYKGIRGKLPARSEHALKLGLIPIPTAAAFHYYDNNLTYGLVTAKQRPHVSQLWSLSQ